MCAKETLSAEIMVTTIKITCDGVFIQSNSLRAAAAAAAQHQQHQQQRTAKSPSTIATAATASGERIIARIRSNSIDRRQAATPIGETSSSGASSPSQSSSTCGASSGDRSYSESPCRPRREGGDGGGAAKQQRPRQQHQELQQNQQQQSRYYFGAGDANNVYWCKQSLLATPTSANVRTPDDGHSTLHQRISSASDGAGHGKKNNKVKNSVSLSAAASGCGIDGRKHAGEGVRRYSSYRPALKPTTAHLVKLKATTPSPPPPGLLGFFARHTPRRKLRRVSSFDCVDAIRPPPTARPAAEAPQCGSGRDLQRLRLGVARFSTVAAALGEGPPSPSAGELRNNNKGHHVIGELQNGCSMQNGRNCANTGDWIDEEEALISRESRRLPNGDADAKEGTQASASGQPAEAGRLRESATTNASTATTTRTSEAFNSGSYNKVQEAASSSAVAKRRGSHRGAGTATTTTTPPAASTAAGVMHSHGTAAAQSGQTSIGGHHRGFSQSAVSTSSAAAAAVAAGVNSAADPWYLQSTGHQMPPTAPIRHNKRPAPQPAIGSGGGTGAAVALLAAGGGPQPHIVAAASHHHHHLPAALNSHHLTAANGTGMGAGIAAVAPPKSPNQQPTASSAVAQHQQQQQMHPHQQPPPHHPHIMSTFGPIAASSSSLAAGVSASGAAAAAANASAGTAAAVAAVAQQQQQQHLQLLAAAAAATGAGSHSGAGGNGGGGSGSLMSSSLNAGHHAHAHPHAHAPLSLHERGLPPKAGGGGGVLLHTAAQSQPASLQAASGGHLTAPRESGGGGHSSLVASAGMSTSLHSFDLNGVGGSAVGTPWANSVAVSSLSPTSSGPVAAGALHHQAQQQRKCEVKLHAMPWFHGSITRDEAEHLLQPRSDGLFLVRESTNFPGDYTLCVCFQGKVEHYRVKYLDNKLTIDDEEYFENLSQLVAHYEADADGLCTQLINCLSNQGRQEFCINSQDFVDKGWVIAETDLLLRESIGKGEFGDVLLGLLRGEKVAVKMLKDEGAVQKFLAEASVMTTLEHENLVKFIGLVFNSKNHIYLVTEYMSKGSLVDYLRSRGRQHITKKDQINFACDTASGMEYLEAKKVVHRDLAARNVLISETCVAKVSDFGLAREECYNLDVGKLPIKWTAPEALKNGRFSNKSDMWSFGILLWEIYSFGRVPYPRIPLADVMKHVEVGYKMEAPEGCPGEIYDMMLQSWDLNPAKRPNFAELKVKLQHFKNITA